jgi:hypothetical protein
VTRHEASIVPLSRRKLELEHLARVTVPEKRDRPPDRSRATGPYHRRVTQNDDHGALPVHAKRLLSRIEDLHSLSVHLDSTHMQHVDHATRARQLAGHLRGVLALSDARRYPSALALVRAALEHHLMDRLIFLATRHVETYGGIKKGRSGPRRRGSRRCR